MLTVALAAAAACAGVAGTWSPCGLSMIATLSPQDHEHGRAVAVVAAVALGLGSIAGGVCLFAGLALLGGVLWGAVALPAAAVALAAAVADLRGLAVLPQIRHQVPESWRRRAPLPLAAAAYGVLLGVGFSTFVMSYALWAAALIALLIGSLPIAVVAGVAFGLGRALPIAVLAPCGDAARAIAVQERMMRTARPLRAVRGCCALALVATAGALAGGPALAAGRPGPEVVATGYAPSADDGALSFLKRAAEQRTGYLRSADGRIVSLGLAPVAIGGHLLAELSGQTITVVQPSNGQALRSFVVGGGVDALAIDGAWLAYRASADPAAGRSSDVIYAQPLAGGTPRVVASVRAPAQLGPPSLSGGRLAFHIAGRTGDRIVVADLGAGSRRVIRSRHDALLYPALSPGALAYVEVGACRERLVLRHADRTRVLASRYTPVARDSGYADGAVRVGRGPTHCPDVRPAPGHDGTFGQLAVTGTSVYVSVIDTSAPRRAPRILRVPR